MTAHSNYGLMKVEITYYVSLKGRWPMYLFVPIDLMDWAEVLRQEDYKGYVDGIRGPADTAAPLTREEAFEAADQKNNRRSVVVTRPQIFDGVWANSYYTEISLAKKREAVAYAMECVQQFPFYPLVVVAMDRYLDHLEEALYNGAA